MPTNEGTTDRILRIVAGGAILSQAFMGLETPWAYVGLVPLLTGLMGYCPVYSVLGISTCPAKRA